jgi:hypothetical protein
MKKTIIIVGVLVWVVLALYGAPKGYEDSEGFHYL